jgi:hypothetical protein
MSWMRAGVAREHGPQQSKETNPMAKKKATRKKARKAGRKKGGRRKARRGKK